MDSAVNTRQTDPHVNPALSTQEIELVARADERLAHAYQQIARADEELARFNEQISRLEKKPANRLRQPSRGRPALRGLIGLLLTAGICTAAFAWQSYGETVRPMISRWVTATGCGLVVAVGSTEACRPAEPACRSGGRGGRSSFAIAAVGADRSARCGSAPIAAEQTQLLQTMARDLASVQQEIEQLKASQAELARESARTAEQLKANQEQMARVIANASEQNPAAQDIGGDISSAVSGNIS